MTRADVSFRAKEAVIAFDPTQVTIEKMVEAVNRLGFRASLKRGEGAAPPESRQ